jgi:cytochrome c-type biogenesis protein CcmH/NrfG
MSAAEVNDLLARADKAKDRGDLDGALRLVSAVLRSKPEDVEANWLAAWVLAQKKDTALAIGRFERVLKLGLDEDRAAEAAAAVKRLKAKTE